jgi:hypothetical protein
MARGPFQGTWQQGSRPTVVTAPDALVYINGRPDLTACSNCRRRFDFNKYVTSVQVDLNVDSAPGSASINLSIPQHSVDDFFVDGVAVVIPMMEIEIYAKGYYLVGGMPQYYPIFWGLITEVSDNYSSGEHTVSISCADILKWWELSKMNINPAFTQTGGQMGRDTNTGNVFHGANVYDIIWSLAQQSMGDVVQAQGSLVSTTREAQSPGTFNALRGDITAYWNARFGQMRSNLLLYGMEGAAVRGDAIFASQPSGTKPGGNKVASTAVRNANGGEASSQAFFDPASSVYAFRSNISNAGPPNMWQSEFQTKLELANVAKEAVGFEFFMDATGDIVFKPPFYNLDTLSNKPVSWIQDIDIIDWNISESEAEVITQLQMSGTYDGGAMDHSVTSDFNTPVSQVTDYHLLRQYGWRVQSMNAEYLSNGEAMFYAGLDMLDRINAHRHRATVTIPMRPELRLGFPVYLAPKDQIWYLSGISHSLSFGGRAQTQLTLTARRGKFIAPKGIGSIQLTKVERPKPPKTASAAVDKANSGKATSVESSVPLVLRSKPTANELSQFGHFNVHIGLAAETPPTNQQAGTFTQDPYEPLVLRHPKTGRIVGYPNVNMVYTRPYKPDTATFKLNAGEKTSPSKPSKTRDVTAANENRKNLEAGLVQNQTRDLIDRHLDGRYIYGMTSAGVYTYVYEMLSGDKAGGNKTRVLQEIVQLPITSIEVSSDTGAALSNAHGTATIRPVSDERGFEVVGHHLYGRGIALRDGSLVLNGDQGNTKSVIDTQLALAGGLFPMLQAQSHGLTTLTASAYGNIADAVAGMAPGDLETAINPETPTPTFMGTGLNFIDTAPLNSPVNRGRPASVEVSQLSRALTIAEMGMKLKDDGGADQQCACLLGRAELAFMNVGYQVEFLKGTAADRSSNASTVVGRQLVELNEQLVEVRRLAALTANDPLVVAQGIDAPLAKEEVEILAQIELFKAQKVKVTGDDDPFASLSSLDLNSPVSHSTTLNLGQTISKVETFLANLYEVLDAPHQEYEKALRGQLIRGPDRATIISSDENQTPPSPFSPPFSVSSRAIGGDPRALALQGSTAVSDIPRSWKAFGDNLRREPKRAALNRQIDQANEKIRSLDAEERRLIAARDSKSLVVGVHGKIDVGESLANLQAERVKTAQQRDNANAKLRQLERTP